MKSTSSVELLLARTEEARGCVSTILHAPDIDGGPIGQGYRTRRRTENPHAVPSEGTAFLTEHQVGIMALRVTAGPAAGGSI